MSLSLQGSPTCLQHPAALPDTFTVIETYHGPKPLYRVTQPDTFGFLQHFRPQRDLGDRQPLHQGCPQCADHATAIEPGSLPDPMAIPEKIHAGGFYQLALAVTEQSLDHIRIVPFVAGQYILKPIEMLEPGECRLNTQPQITQPDPHTLFPVLHLGYEVRYLPKQSWCGWHRRGVTAPTATAGHNQLENFEPCSRMFRQGIQPRLFRSRHTQHPAPTPQTRLVLCPQQRLSIAQQHGFKQPIAICQAAIINGNPGRNRWQIHALLTWTQRSRAKTRVPLVPPKPKELDSATSIFVSRAVCGT